MVNIILNYTRCTKTKLNNISEAAETVVMRVYVCASHTNFACVCVWLRFHVVMVNIWTVMVVGSASSGFDLQDLSASLYASRRRKHQHHLQYFTIYF